MAKVKGEDSGDGTQRSNSHQRQQARMVGLVGYPAMSIVTYGLRVTPQAGVKTVV